ncbi:MAG TPA: HAD family hydrolase [Parafilimonas sp.]|nr:HAD family hydrolase [Parafilimonas sp.]
MLKKAIIFDLDNTIYAVHTIGEELFASLFELITQDGNHAREMDKIRDEIMRRPFQLVANDYHFSEALTNKGIALLKDITYDGKIEPFEDYPVIRKLPVDKFLVTTGFLKLQQSKIEGMKIASDFKEIHIVDPLTSARTKRDVFEDIIQRHGYDKSEVLVVGDDLHSEIKAAQDLGIEAILYDRLQLHTDYTSVKRIENFNELVSGEW